MSSSQEIEFSLNGDVVRVRAAAGQRLLDLLRGPLQLPGTKEGCGHGECGACTVLVDGQAVNACLYPASEAAGRQVTTIEGLGGPGGELSVIQRAFVEHGAIQCGFCSPGMIVSTHALLQEDPAPDEDAIRQALLGNLCRCTGYVQIVEAVQHAARQLRGEAR